MRAIVCTGPNNYSLSTLYTRQPKDYIIGADQGAYILAKNEIPFDLAVGDFDSVSKSELEHIKKYAKNINEYPIKKDYTDTHLAIIIAQEQGYDEIVIYGGLGERLDHTFANVHLLTLGNITMVSDKEKVYVITPGTHKIKNEFKYISFFAFEDVKELSLTGFDYPLVKHNLKRYVPLCVSNKGEGTVSFSAGLLLVIHQNE